jgi:hypothetical protein
MKHEAVVQAGCARHVKPRAVSESVLTVQSIVEGPPPVIARDGIIISVNDTFFHLVARPAQPPRPDARRASEDRLHSSL